MEKQTADWIAQGYAANLAGSSVGSNPYRHGAPWKAWRVGWYRANGERLAKKAS